MVEQPGADRQRPELVPAPSDGEVAEILALFDDIAEINRASTELLDRVETLTGLRLGELQALVAISRGADHPRVVARRTSQVDAAAAATTQTLIRRGLVGRHHHPDAPADASNATLLHVTDAGTVALQQGEGIQLRVLEAVVLALGHRQTRDLRASIQALSTVLDTDANTPTTALGEQDRH